MRNNHGIAFFAIVIVGALLMVSPTWAQQIKVAGVLPASVKDLSWNAGLQKALQNVEEKLGVETSLTEMVGQGDSERVIRDYANRGYDLIFCHSFNFQDACVKVAADFPDINFANMSGYKTAPNVIACDWLAHETGFLAGVIAGLMTKTDRIGAIGGFAVPSVVRTQEGYRLGAKTVNPEVEVITVFPGTWADSQKGFETAIAMIENRVDIIMSDGNGLTVGAIKAAEEKEIKAIACIGDLHLLAPNTVLTSVVYDFSGTVETLTERTIKGTFKEGSRFLALGSELAPYRGNVPEEVAKKVDEYREKISSGELKVPSIDKPPEKE